MSGDAVTAFIGLGANLGVPRAAIASALDAIAKIDQTVLVARSSIYRTAPLDAPEPDYLNAVAELRTRLTPLGLLHRLQAIERRHGRERPFTNAPRTLDLDLLLHGETTLQTPELTLPHPRAHERAFVLVPLAEIAPSLVIPGRGAVRDLLASVADQRVDKLAA